jgi:3'-phosphoadenosine 5'-phosphosulfate sulfotransferase (PAPS reductase)/FAD synthetase
MTPELQTLVDEAHALISETLPRFSNPVLAYSGGKDALVVAHLMKQHGLTKGVCEMSFYFDRQDKDVRATAAMLGMDVDFVSSRDDEWLSRHPEFVFADDTKIRSRSFKARQQDSVRRYTRTNKHDLIVFGRRTEENTVKASLYKTDFWSFHPIRLWREHHVWEYLSEIGVPKPWIYDTPFGQITGGNGPFYAVRASKTGGRDAAWRMVNEMDPSITPARFGW